MLSASPRAKAMEIPPLRPPYVIISRVLGTNSNRLLKNRIDYPYSVVKEGFAYDLRFQFLRNSGLF